jgi:hypothetical protein
MTLDTFPMFFGCFSQLGDPFDLVEDRPAVPPFKSLCGALWPRKMNSNH